MSDQILSQTLSRRGVIQGALGAFTLLCDPLSSGSLTRALAQSNTDPSMGRYFLHLCFDGGWDLLLGLDPRRPEEFPDSSASETGIETAYTRLPAQYPRQPIQTATYELGPCVGELSEWTQEISVVRGIDMATLTHEVGRRHFNTARAPSGISARGSSVSTMAAATLGGDHVIPHLAHRVETYNIDQESEATALLVSSVDHLQYLLQETLGIPSYMPSHIRGALNNFWAAQREAYEHKWSTQEMGVDGGVDFNTSEGQKLIQRYLSSRAQARRLVTQSLHESFQFNHSNQATLRAHYGITPQQLDTAYGRAALAAQALKTGLSRVVNLSLAEGLDTHDARWAPDHSVRLEEGFNALARLLRDLSDTPDPQGGSLLDHTTIVVTSEFSRTPRLNIRQGRDHHLANAALLMGRGIQGGRVVGATSPLWMSPLKVNLDRGEVDEGGVSIRPEEVMFTALTALGVHEGIDLRAKGTLKTILS